MWYIVGAVLLAFAIYGSFARNKSPAGKKSGQAVSVIVWVFVGLLALAFLGFILLSYRL